MSPLYHLLQKNVPFAWGPSQQDSFDRIKQLFKHDNVLQHYDPNAELMLETDASSYGLGAVLMQRLDAHSSWVPVQFASRTLFCLTIVTIQRHNYLSHNSNCPFQQSYPVDIILFVPRSKSLYCNCVALSLLIYWSCLLHSSDLVL